MLAMPYQIGDREEISRKLNRQNLAENYQHGQMQTSLSYRRVRSGALPIWVSMNIHTYMMPETGDLECFTYAYDVSSKMENDEIMGLISDEQFDYISLIYAKTDEFEYIKKSPQITLVRTRQRASYSRACTYVCEHYLGEEERADYEKAISLASIISGLNENAGRYTTTYRRTEQGRVLCKQLDYVWISREEQIILAVRSDVTPAFERDQQQLARIREAKLEADRANEAKSTFLSSMSHDIRTPLNGVIGFTGLALKEQDPEKKQEYLEKIDSSSRLLLDLVNDTLELSRIESGKMTLEPEAVMPDDLIPAVVTALRPSAELKGIHLTAEYGNDPSKPVWCDRLKVQKIVLNLISNAIKYTPEGGTVSVRLIPAEKDGVCRWSLAIADTGIGMSEEFMKRMFEPFAQEKRSESLKTPGTGLGLAIVKRYVDLMGGTIEVKSVIHKGTSWLVTLPITEVPDSKVKKQERRAEDFMLAGKRVLLCEDNYMNTEIAVMLLKEKGIQVDTAENGQEGLDRFTASECGYYDAVLMDLRMPVMDGNTAARRIRALERPDASSVPIIAMTADAFEESVREAQEAGMNGYITKPVEPGRLFSELAEQMQNTAKESLHA
jgi:signal transduction histidine kinase/CheY-like chemotaxis protein